MVESRAESRLSIGIGLESGIGWLVGGVRVFVDGDAVSAARLGAIKRLIRGFDYRKGALP